MQFVFVRCALVHYIIFSAHSVLEATDTNAERLGTAVPMRVVGIVVQVPEPRERT